VARRSGLGIAIPWVLVGVGVLAACLLALFGPFGQIQCTTRVLPNSATEHPPLPLVRGHPATAVLCTNVGGYPMIGAP
jgi:hypothetical protein